MTEDEKMALKLMPYTCPTLDQMAKEYAWRFDDYKEEKEFLAFIEEIKKQITCPMRTALEEACQVALDNEARIPTEEY